MASITVTLERINQLRKKAQKNPEFVQSANAHKKAIEKSLTTQSTSKRKKAKKKKRERFSSIYSGLADKPAIYS